MRSSIFLVVTTTIFGATFMSCSKNNENTADKDLTYPTIIYRLSEDVLLQRRNDFAKKNPYVSTTLNQFGFCAPKEEWSAGVATPSGSFTEKEAIAAVREFAARNPEYTGVSEPNSLNFRVVERDELTNGWLFRARNQMMNNIEIECTEFIFHIRNKAVSYCHGNHFPNVYVPKKFNFDVEQAKSQLLGKEIFHWGWGGQYSAGIVTTEHLKQSTAKLIIVPITTDEKIELRVAWQIYIETLSCIIEIDVMTGEIIREMPTIIS